MSPPHLSFFFSFSNSFGKILIHFFNVTNNVGSNLKSSLGFRECSFAISRAMRLKWRRKLYSKIKEKKINFADKFCSKIASRLKWKRCYFFHVWLTLLWKRTCTQSEIHVFQTFLLAKFWVKLHEHTTNCAVPCSDVQTFHSGYNIDTTHGTVHYAVFTYSKMR